jgi:Tfp pilus assembly protein PilN
MQASLNFLSPEKKSELRAGFALAYAQTSLLILCLIVAFASGVLFALRLFVSSSFDELDARVQKTSDDSKTVSTEVDKMNAYLGRVDRYQRRFVAWSPVVASIARSMPPGTQISSLLIAPDGSIQLGGTSQTREGVLALQENLKKNALFKNVSSPLSNILQERNVAFQFSMSYANIPTVPPEGSSTAPRGRKKAAADQ